MGKYSNSKGRQPSKQPTVPLTNQQKAADIAQQQWEQIVSQIEEGRVRVSPNK